MPSDHPATILIVDDELINLEILAHLLKRQGYQVILANDGPGALQIILNAPVDIVLLDIIMPAMNGYEVCRRIKQNPATAKIPVLFLTALNEEKDKLKGFDIGAVDYITKPFDAQVVLARVNVHLTIDQLRRHLKNENRRFRSLVEATFEALLIHVHGLVVDANQNLERLTGCNRQQLIGQKIEQLFVCQEHFRSNCDHCSQVNGLHVSSHIDKIDILSQNSKPIPCEMLVRDFFWKGQPAQVIALRDITWRKQLEQKAIQLESENLNLKASLSDRSHLGGLIGHSLVMRKVYEYLVNIAASDKTVIIYGETGTGKELAAQTIFQLSRRQSKAFIPVNCGAIPQNLFESEFFGYRKGSFTGAERNMPGHLDKAQGGVLFLDEIAELSLSNQIKMLRVLNDKSYTPVGASRPRQADVRIIAATTRNLKKLVDNGRIRPDFFYRIHVLNLEMPPLRDHKEDIPLLVNHFFTHHTLPDKNRPIISNAIADILHGYHWPGNVRELFNELSRYLFSGKIELVGNAKPSNYNPTQAATLAREDVPFNQRIADYEKRLIADALHETGGNKKAAAQLLQMPLATMHRKIKRFGLNQA